MGLISKPIFPKLASRYGIRQEGSEQIESGHQLVPTTNADELLRTLKYADQTSSAASATLDLTCPVGKRYTILGAFCDRVNAGQNDLQFAFDGVTFRAIDRATASTFTRFVLNAPFSMNAPSILRVAAGTGTGGTITLGILYYEEDAF